MKELKKRKEEFKIIKTKKCNSEFCNIQQKCKWNTFFDGYYASNTIIALYPSLCKSWYFIVIISRYCWSHKYYKCVKYAWIKMIIALETLNIWSCHPNKHYICFFFVFLTLILNSLAEYLPYVATYLPVVFWCRFLFVLHL